MKKYLSKRSQFFLSFLVTCSTVILSNTTAKALNFNFTYAEDTTLEQRLGFEMAGKIWSSYLTDDIDVEIHVEMTDLLPKNVIGGALPGIDANQQFRHMYDQLDSDRTSVDDTLAFTTMATDNGKQFRGVADNYQINNNQHINLTRANSKALGLIDSSSHDLDGYILMSNLTAESVDWNYDFQNYNVPDNTLDYLSVALHEIGHVIGFVSGVDDPNWLSSLFKAQESQSTAGEIGRKNPESNGSYDQLGVEQNYVTMLDMFRFSEESTSFTENYVDLSVGGQKYFSIDGGDTDLGKFSTGKKGDGYQASHWKEQDNPLGIMDPTLGLGEQGNISELDLRAFDVIGYDRQPGAVNLDLLSLFDQTKQELADELGIGVGYIDEVLDGATYDLIDQALADSNQDRTQDVIDMIEGSEVYEWGFGGGDGDGCDPNTQNCGNSQVLAQILTNEGLFSQSYWSTLDIESESVEVPDSSPMTALLGLGLLSCGWLVKGNKKYD